MLEHNKSFGSPNQPSSLGDLLAESSSSGQDRFIEEAIDFLRKFDPVGRHTLVALDPAEKLDAEARTFGGGEFEKIADWLRTRSGRRNLYFHPNEPRPEAGNSKLSKSDVGAIRALFADLDPKGEAGQFVAERLRLKALVDEICAGPCPPTFVTDSGSGFHLFWMLPEKADASVRSRAEAIGKSIAVKLDGDNVWNIDRMMRLPGMMNLPTAVKIAKGRTPRRAALVSSTDTKTSLDTIERHYPAVLVPASTDDGSAIDNVRASLDEHQIYAASNYEELPASLRGKFERHRDMIPELDQFWRLGEPSGPDKTRSAARFELAKWLKSLLYDASEFGALLWIWDHAVKPGEDIEIKLDPREISRNWANAPRVIRIEGWFEPIDDEAGSNLDAPAAKSGKRLKLISFDDAVMTALSSNAQPLVKGVLDKGAFSVIYGDSNVGKTFVALDIAFSIASGTMWSDRKVVQAPVVYVAAEGGSGVDKRLLALTKKYSGASGRGVPFHRIAEPVNLLRADADLRLLIDTVRSVPDVGLVVIDTLSRALAGGDENSSVDMGHLVTNLDTLRKQTGAHIMVIHHSGKNAARGARGHSLLRAALDTEIEIADSTIVVKKQRDLDGDFQRSFTLVKVRLGTDADGDPIMSCFIELVARSDVAPREATPAEQLILDALEDLAENQPKRTGFPPQEIARAIANVSYAPSIETVRTQLRALDKKGLTVKTSRGHWLLKRPTASLTGFFEPLDADGQPASENPANGRKAVNDVFK